MWRILIVGSVLSQTTCPTYNCHGGGYSISPYCAEMNPSGDITLQICDTPRFSYCDTTGSIADGYICTSRPPRKQPIAYPGEPCIENSDCITNLCTANTCIGANAGNACVSNSDCDVGFYCGSSFFCTQQLQINSACTSDYQCQNNLGCNNTLFSPGQCIPYYSIPSGYPVGTCIEMLTEGVSNLCSSGSCYLLNPGYNSIGVCEPAYSNFYGFPNTCEVDQECVGYNGVNITIGACSCGMDMYGRAYCDSFAADPPGLTVKIL